MRGCLPVQAPELVLQCYDEKCDIWSVGMLTYQVLSGAWPFRCSTRRLAGCAWLVLCSASASVGGAWPGLAGTVRGLAGGARA